MPTCNNCGTDVPLRKNVGGLAKGDTDTCPECGDPVDTDTSDRRLTK